MGYAPEPAPGLSELEDMHQLQRHARSLGKVAVDRLSLQRLLAVITDALERIDRMPK